MYLISQGMSYKDVQDIPATYFMDIWYLIQTGAVGWYGENDARYMAYCAAHSMSSVKPKPQHQLYPEIMKMRRLGREPKINLAAKWAAVLPTLEKGRGA